MGGVAVLHSQDVLRDGYNRMPLISPSPSTNQALKSRFTNTSSSSNSKAVSSFNRRKKSPQKKSNFDHNSSVYQKKVNVLSRSPQKGSTVDQTSNYSKKKINDFSKSLQKTSNFDHNFKLPQKKINNFDQKANSGNLAKGGANFSNGKISTGNKLVMEKVKILKRGEVLANDEDTKIERVSSDTENVIVNLVENNEVSNTKKKLLFDEENKCEKVVNVEKNGDETMPKMFAKENEYEKVVEVERNGDEKTPKKMVLFDRDGKNKKKGILEPKMVTKHNPLPDFYATAAFVASPDPSSLPFPPFLKKGVAVIESTPKIDCSEGDVFGSNLLRKVLKIAF